MLNAKTVAAIQTRAEKGQSINQIAKDLGVTWKSVKGHLRLTRKEHTSTPTNGRTVLQAESDDSDDPDDDEEEVFGPSSEGLMRRINRIFLEAEYSDAQKAELLSKLYRAVDEFVEDEKTDEN